MGGDSVAADRAAFTPIHHRLGSIDCADWRCRLGLRLAGRPGQTNRLVRACSGSTDLARESTCELYHQRHSLQECGWQTGRMATIRTTRPVYRTAQTRLDPLPCCSRSTLFCQNEFLNPQRWFAIDPAQILYWVPLSLALLSVLPPVLPSPPNVFLRQMPWAQSHTSIRKNAGGVKTGHKGPSSIGEGSILGCMVKVGDSIIQFPSSCFC